MILSEIWSHCNKEYWGQADYCIRGTEPRLHLHHISDQNLQWRNITRTIDHFGLSKMATNYTSVLWFRCEDMNAHWCAMNCFLWQMFFVWHFYIHSYVGYVSICTSSQAHLCEGKLHTLILRFHGRVALRSWKGHLCIRMRGLNGCSSRACNPVSQGARAEH